MSIPFHEDKKKKKEESKKSNNQVETKRTNKEKKKIRKEKKQRQKKIKKEEKKESRIKRTEEKRNQKIQNQLRNEENRIKCLSNQLTSWLKEEKIAAIAVATGYLKKLNTKIPPLPFLLTIAFGMYGNGSSTYIMLAQNMGEWFKIYITAQALFGRMSKINTVNFLKEVLIVALSVQIKNGFKNQYANIFSCFKDVHIEDSTQFILHENVSDAFRGSGGSASKAAMKLNVAYSLTKNVVSNVDVVEGATSDQTLSKKVRKLIKKGELWIRDLGYFNIFDLSFIDEMGAYYLSRIKKGVKVYLAKDSLEPIDVIAFLKENTANGKSINQIVFIGNEKMMTRLIAEKVPEEVQQKRISSYLKNKIKRNKKKNMTEEYVEWFNYSIYITNITSEMIQSASLIMTVYKVRWQIELFFLRIKSILQIDIIKGESKNRVYCIIYAKLISLLTAQSIVSYAAGVFDGDDEVSEYKIMVWLKNNNKLGSIVASGGGMEDLLKELIRVHYLLCKNKRGRKSTLQKVKEAFEDEINRKNSLDRAA